MLEHELLRLDVSAYVEKKKDLSYLSWSHAWAQALNHDHTANFHVQTFDGKPYMDVNGTAMVWVSVTMGGNTRTCWLPVMNSSNAPISIAGRSFKDKWGNEKVEKLDSFNVNTAIMRCLTKCLGMFGLGLNVYAGEDLPLIEDDKPETKPETKPNPKTEPETKPETKPEKPAEKPAEKPVSKPDVHPDKIHPDKKEVLTQFADLLITHLDLQKTEKDLRGYWKTNQTQLDELKAIFPDLYALVQEKFTETKLKIKEQANG